VEGVVFAFMSDENTNVENVMEEEFVIMDDGKNTVEIVEEVKYANTLVMFTRVKYVKETESVNTTSTKRGVCCVKILMILISKNKIIDYAK